VKGCIAGNLRFETATQIIKNMNLVTACHESITYMRTNKTGTAGNKNFHRTYWRYLSRTFRDQPYV